MSLPAPVAQEALGQPGPPAARSWVAFKRAFYEHGRGAFGEWPRGLRGMAVMASGDGRNVVLLLGAGRLQVLVCFVGTEALDHTIGPVLTVARVSSLRR